WVIAGGHSYSAELCDSNHCLVIAGRGDYLCWQFIRDDAWCAALVWGDYSYWRCIDDCRLVMACSNDVSFKSRRYLIATLVSIIKSLNQSFKMNNTTNRHR